MAHAAVLKALPETYLIVILAAAFAAGLVLGLRFPFRRRSGRRGPDPRQSPEYILGMYAMLAGDVETAIEKLSHVVEISTEPVEVYLALGNLYRQRGQIDRAIRVHQSLLARGGLSDQERVLALNALGSDYRTGGFLDRSLKTFREVLALHPKDGYALGQLLKLAEDLGEWEEAYQHAVLLQKVQRQKNPRALSYLLAQKAQQMAEAGSTFRAAWLLRRAIRLLPENVLAYMFLVRLYLRADKPRRARRVLDRALREMPYKSYMLLDLLKEVCLKMEDPAAYLEELNRLAREHHQKRALLQYLQECLDLRREDQLPGIVRDLVRHFGRSRLVQRTLWDLLRRDLLDDALAGEVAAALGGSELMTDAYTCMYCGYKTLEVLHRCPNCKEWSSFADGEG